ncbi:glycosyltransferase [Chlorobium sp. N1]|uniref:glycosyltransferase n=1 Tax=Chlorobium sp. N1 TaxID=2491138 RepID=UPI001039F542|nr:glycosyltransferase [Chlorobium sp. N1]TCD47750.1 glycosyltransferase [Chlorobium sp. N1]
MKKLQIALISPFPPMPGGISRFSSELSRAFRATGHGLHPVGFRALYPGFLLRILGVPPSRPEPAAGGTLVLFDPLSWIRTALELRRRRPDVILIAYWAGFLAPLCFVIRRLSGIRTVALLHNLTSHESFFFEPLMRRLLFLSVDGVVTLSETVARQAAESLPRTPRLELQHPDYAFSCEPPPKEEARRQLKLPLDGTLLLFFGYVRRYKGLDLLIEALALLPSGSDVRLVVAGEFYEPLERYRKLISSLGLEDRVVIHPGYVPAGRTQLYFAAADACVLPYRSATQSGVAGIARGSRLPIIVTPAGSLAQSVHGPSSGVIAGGCTAPALAGAIEAFLGAASLGLEYCVDGGLSWEGFARSAADFLAEGTGGRP